MEFYVYYFQKKSLTNLTLNFINKRCQIEIGIKFIEIISKRKNKMQIFFLGV